ncbi:MAG: PP2C family protein-serine/threonine phosphatase, partial [Planctomycetota bacterium]
RKLLPVPNRMPLGDHVEWASHFEPETEVGGDYFDVAALDEHRASVVFADVSGHGMSAALITVIVKMAFLFWVEAGWSLSEFVLCVNRELCRLTPEGSFVVLVAAIYDGKDGCLRFVNAGHSPEPFFLPADTGAPVRVLSQRGSMLLGVRANIEVAEATQPLAPGDAVLFATDGLNEAQNSRGELYGKQRLLRRLVEHRARPLEPLVSAVLDDIDNFTAGIEQTDDRTLLAFRVRPSGKQFAGTK